MGPEHSGRVFVLGTGGVILPVGGLDPGLGRADGRGRALGVVEATGTTADGSIEGSAGVG